MHDVAGAPRGSTAQLLPQDLIIAIEAEAAGDATAPQLALLAADRHGWRTGLQELLRETDAALASVRSLSGPERGQVVGDFERERASLAA
ncbi:MAG: hypothetical protein H0T70_10425, partial [Acidimicrobiia bacterium]|nr:hypothetical protein [Acidimicrobiia bacterium]